VELVWTNNQTMQTLNQEYRQKEGPTDVLTFTLLADAEDPDLWMSLPVLQLGSIFVSVEYAQNAILETPDTPLERYLIERFVHGMLHLFGMHHDTMEKFEKVVTIQNRVLESVFQ
jgi:probable rRNA maturation factor